MWAISRIEANKNGDTHQKQKFPIKVMVWLGACSQSLTPLIILDSGTINQEKYVGKVLPVAKRWGNKLFKGSWRFQQDGATAHTHNLSQKWCMDNLPNFISDKR